MVMELSITITLESGITIAIVMESQDSITTVMVMESQGNRWLVPFLAWNRIVVTDNE